MQFEVRAITNDDLVIRHAIEAHSEADARRQAEALGLFVFAIKPVITGIANFRRQAAKKSPAKFSLLLFSQELLSLLNAGLSLVESLETLREKHGDSGDADILETLISGLREGRRFSQVMEENPAHFPPLFIGIIRASESTSDLPSSLRRYIDYQQRVDSIKNKVVSALIYPSILLTVGGAVTLFLAGYVVPRFAEIYRGAGRDLPLMSQLLLDWGQFVSAHASGMAISLAIGIGTLALLVKRAISRGGLAGIVRHIPGVGERIHVYELSRLYLTLGMLLEGGIPVVAAMEGAGKASTPAISEALRRASSSIASGTPLSTAFRNNGLTTPVSLRMLGAGERSGNLGNMLTQSASFYEAEIARWIDHFTRTFEPALMAAIGLLVGGIVVLLYMPIFDLAGSLS